MKNTNPIYLIEFELYRYGLNDAEINALSNTHTPKGISNADVFAKSGSILGGVAGAGVGIKAGQKIFKNKERKEIKNIILKSDSPDDCILKLKELGTPKALQYCDIVRKVSAEKPNGWKYDIATSINLKNISGGAAGALGGSYLGNRIGHYIGIGAAAPEIVN